MHLDLSKLKYSHIHKFNRLEIRVSCLSFLKPLYIAFHRCLFSLHCTFYEYSMPSLKSEHNLVLFKNDQIIFKMNCALTFTTAMVIWFCLMIFLLSESKEKEKESSWIASTEDWTRQTTANWLYFREKLLFYRDECGVSRLTPYVTFALRLHSEYDVVRSQSHPHYDIPTRLLRSNHVVAILV